MEVIKILIGKVSPHPKNARKHDQTNINIIKKSLEEYGQMTPIIIGRNNYILKGCGTWQAAKELGWRTISARKVQGLSPEQELAFALMDNKSSDTSEFDFEQVSEIIKFLDSEGFDLEATGFQDFELEPLMEAEWSPGEIGNMPESNTVDTENMQLLKDWIRLEERGELNIDKASASLGIYTVTKRKNVPKRKK